ncbi:MAG TPA: MFS transporter [Candidatus Eisenbacteria bacterium]|nr:MFS transporter [Candidatus Eisenbacteria bacterium]
MTDRKLLLAGAFFRALATGMIGVLIGIHLARQGMGAAAIGSVISAGLAGAAAAGALVTFGGDRFGRRRTLITLSLLGGAGGLVVAFASDAWVVGAAAFLGMLNGMGRDRGASSILDQAVLPATATDQGRTAAFAAYNVVQDAGHALGALAAGIPALLRMASPLSEADAIRVAVGIYAALLASTALFYRRLSPAVEVPAAKGPKLSPESRRVLTRISALFALDSIGGGFLVSALIAYFFFKRFGVDESVTGLLFFFARAANAGSHFAAAWLAKRIGLVNTMVFTHIPSSLLLLTVPFAPTFPIAAALFLLREGLVEMDVPTRQSYVMAVVAPHERTAASGVTSLVRLGGWAVAPGFAGMAMAGTSLGAPLVVGASLKIVYDILLYAAFRRLPPPEERRGSAPK